MKCRILLPLILAVVLSGCSADEVIYVGTPFNDKGSEGVTFHMEIKDSESIQALRKIMDKVEDIEEPKDLPKEPGTFFHWTDLRKVFLSDGCMSGIKMTGVQFYIMTG